MRAKRGNLVSLLDRLKEIGKLGWKTPTYQGKGRSQKHDQREVILKPVRIEIMEVWNIEYRTSMDDLEVGIEEARSETLAYQEGKTWI